MTTVTETGEIVRLFDRWSDGGWERVHFGGVRKGDILAGLGRNDRRNGTYMRVTSDLKEDGDGPCFEWEPAIDMVPDSALEAVLASHSPEHV